MRQTCDNSLYFAALALNFFLIRLKQQRYFDSFYDEHESSEPVENDESRLQMKLFDEFWSNQTELELTKGSLATFFFFKLRSRYSLYCIAYTV